MAPYRESLRLALPLILSNLTVPFLGMVDTAVVGRLDGPQHLAAVALGAAVMSMILWIFGFLRMGTSGFTAQAYGRGDPIEIKAALLRSLVVAAAIGITILLTSNPLASFTAWIYQAEGATLDGFLSYLGIRLWGAPAMLMNHVLIGWFLGRQNPYVPLLMMSVANGLNALLDVVLVFQVGMGVDGVAVATVCADYSGLLIGGAIASATWRKMRGGVPNRRRLLDPVMVARFVALSRDLVLRTLMMQIVFFGFTAIGARQGDLLLAANAVLMTFFTLQANGLDGFADATEAMSGRAVGRRCVDELRAAFHAGLVNGLVLTALLSLAFWWLGDDVVALLTTQTDIREAAAPYLPYIALLPIMSIVAFICDGLFFGATRGRELRNSLLVSSLVFVAAALVLVPSFGNHGLWLAFLLFMAVRGLTLLLAYRRAGSGAGFIEGVLG